MKRRTPDQIEEAVKKAEQEIENGSTVKAAREKYKISPAVWIRHRTKKPKSKIKKKEVTLTQIAPIEMSQGKTILIMSEDKDLILSIIENFNRS